MSTEHIVPAAYAACLAGLVIGRVRADTAVIPLKVVALTGLGGVVTLALVHPWRVRRGERVPPSVVRPPSLQEVAP